MGYFANRDDLRRLFGEAESGHFTGVSGTGFRENEPVKCPELVQSDQEKVRLRKTEFGE
jgi:hypothetical protein